MVLSVILNGLSRAMLLFLIASGLSLIFGLMGVVNFAHGAFYAMGGYFGVWLFGLSETFWLALIIAPFFVAFIGVAVEYFTIRPLYSRDPIYQILLTFGIAMVVEELIILFNGANSKSMPAAELLSGVFSATSLNLFYPKYRLFIIFVGAVIGLALWLFLDRTRVGMIIRAGTFDSEMVEALGINVRRVFTGMFALGVGLAALGGVVAGPLLSVTPGMGTGFIVDAFIVVVIGGLGSVRGSFAGALLIGMAEAFGGYYISKYVGFVIFTVMIIVLVARPQGIFGKETMIEH